MRFIVVSQLINDGVRRCWRISCRAFQSSLPSSATPRVARIRPAIHRRRDQRAVCFVSTGRRSPHPPLARARSTSQIARSSRACMGRWPQERRASVCGSAAGVALRLRFARRSSAPSAPLSPLADRRPKPQLDFPRAIRRISACRSSNSRVCATSAANTDSFGSAVRYSRTSNLLPKPSIA